jgi:hypothetical protein
MSLSKHTKAELLEMLSSQGIDAKSSMKKADLIELLENASTSEAQRQLPKHQNLRRIPRVKRNQMRLSQCF